MVNFESSNPGTQFTLHSLCFLKNFPKQYFIEFSVYPSCTSFVKLNSEYFVYAITNGNFFSL